MGCNLIIDVDTEVTHLFVPRLDSLYRIWMTVKTLEQIKEKYQVEVHFNDEIDAFLKELSPAFIYLNVGTNSDSDLSPALPKEEYWKNYL